MPSFVKWGARQLPIHPKLAAVYESVREPYPALYDTLWRSMTQGASSHPGDRRGPSAGTHDLGYAADHVYANDPRWNLKMARTAHAALGGKCALGFRAAGELGEGNPGHVHIALWPYSNSRAIRAAQQDGGANPLRAQLQRSFPRDRWDASAPYEPEEEMVASKRVLVNSKDTGFKAALDPKQQTHLIPLGAVKERDLRGATYDVSETAVNIRLKK